MDTLPFIDAHVHLWDLARIPHPWLSPPFDAGGPNGSVEAIAEDYGLDDYLAEAGRWDVLGMVHVEAGADPARSLDETSWLQDMADRTGFPIAIVAHVDLLDPDLDRSLARQASHPAVRGVRQIVNHHADPARTYTARDLTLDPRWEEGYGRLADYGFSFDLQAYPAQFARLAEIAARHADVPVVLNHAGMMLPGGEAEWRDGVELLAALPHVAVKLSGFGFHKRPFDASFASDVAGHLIRRFGPERVMFASDFPTDRLFGSFDEHLSAYVGIASGYDERDRRAMFAGNANRLYRMGMDLEP